ncbi:MAG: SGNH/GDSL hydrolase family protein [Saprospiraceae bacterium]|nr:SGNH/GDSL hydrolase family protein [Saprospiraceae bacterium]
MSKPPLSRGRKAVFSLILLGVMLVLVVAIGEVFVRLKYQELYRKNPLVPPYDTAEKDDLLGWKMRPGYTYTGEMKDVNKQPYPISLHYDQNGFKAFGDTASNRPKVLFLGDSYTASIEASNEQTFYNILADSLDFEVFAYGHAGFGTLQEYLVLDKWVDRIKPDVVVWETCSNDFIDNHAPLEIACGYKVGQRRPYLAEDGSIFYRRPLSVWQRLKEPIWFFRWLEERWDGVKQNLFKQEKRVGEYYIATQKRDYPLFDESVKTTERIVAMIRKRLPETTKLVAFSADIYEPQMSEMKRIFEASGASFHEAPARLLEQKMLEQKLPLKAVDNCHWSEQGQAVIAKGLKEVLSFELGVLSGSPTQNSKPKTQNF